MDAGTDVLAVADAGYRPDPDIELVERFSLHWESNAAVYRQTLDELRLAARRLLPILKHGSARSDVNARVRRLEEEIACLALQPVCFTEMFHGQTLSPGGGFTDLVWSDRVHYRPGGLLGIEDRLAVVEIYERISNARRGPLRVVEIGSAAGRGSTRIGGDCVRRSGGTLYCIDPWDGLMHLAFLANMRIFDLEATVVPIRARSCDAASLFDDGSLDAVFVDGNHIYPNVVADIDCYLPKVRKGGFIFGHDLHDVPSRFDRNELLGVADRNNTEVNYINARNETVRVDVHPGVILAVQDKFGDDVELFPGSVVWARKV